MNTNARWNRSSTCVGASLLAGWIAVSGNAAAAETPSLDEMWRVIQEQQKVIEDLRTKLAATEGKVRETVENVEATAEAVEQASVQRQETGGHRTTVGGYGELHYNRLDDDRDTVDGDDSISNTDFHRFVIYLGHEFTDRLRFFSELEIEHAFVSVEDAAAGEVELEQAWVEYNASEHHRVRAGVDVLPVGILNTRHEPDTFYGVERNPVESEIIPSTWWEAGVGVSGDVAPGWNYSVVVHSGLEMETAGTDAFRPHEGVRKVSEVADQAIAFTGQLRYTSMPGLEVGISGDYEADVTGTADDIDISGTLFEGHVDWKHASGFGLRALYARWDFGDDHGFDPAAINADTLAGWYVEPAYRFALPRAMLGEAGVFARYSQWDQGNGLDEPVFRFTRYGQFVVGFNWWPHANLAFKFDAQWENAGQSADRIMDGFNLGMAYQF